MSSLGDPQELVDDESIEDGEDDDRGRFVQTVFAKTSRSMLRLSNLKLEDSGEYKIKVENGQHDKTETFTLIVTDSPKVKNILFVYKASKFRPLHEKRNIYNRIRERT